MNFESLYAPYSAVASLEETLGWVQREAIKLGIDSQCMNQAINDTFIEMEGGKIFPVDGGTTGFDNIPHAVLNHYILSKMILFHKTSIRAYNKATEGILQKRMENIIKKEVSRWKWFLNCNNSITLKFLKLV